MTRRKLTRADEEALDRADQDSPRGAAGGACALAVLVAVGIFVAAYFVGVAWLR